MAAAPYRWTIDEYVLRVELADATLREVIVEGSTDRSFVEGVLERYDANGVTVFDAEYFQITGEEVALAGFPAGVKGSLLTLASRVADSDYAAGEAVVVVVVDRDLDGAPEGAVADVAVATDYYSMESYALSVRALDQFVRRVLVREVRPPGAAGVPPGDRNACTGEDLFGRLTPACDASAAVRLVLARLVTPPAVVGSWIDYFQVAADGSFELRGRELLEASLQRHGPVDPEIVDRFEDVLVEVEAERRMLVRGRDFMELLHKLLKSPWGRRVSSVNFSQVDHPTLTTWLLNAIPHADLDEEPLFRILRERFA